MSRARIKPPSNTQAERDAISLGKIESFLDKALEGKCVCSSCKKDFDIKDLSPNVLKAVQLRYDKLRPALSAVEQTNINPEESKTEDQILQQLQALIAANPELVQKALAANAKAQPEPLKAVNE